ncbi:MAG: hypothetical protein KZQ92_07395 [Candidatus Thiodiazotropha sp. (ex Lucinoma borealis)]|nr:hypothetical protein [Candidatus Thiodiazotropha sp. (ex Lucinoma borealis)]MCU7863787.1 hypothetical protein [Candidatus Thiodiazotropha sp. (ex Lucinoma borealis)]
MELTTASLTAKVCDDTDIEKLRTALEALRIPVTYTDGDGQSIQYSPVSKFSFTRDGELKIDFQHIAVKIVTG